jgi:membrane protein required for colicin V production
MNNLDYVILAIIVLGALYGLGRGAIRMTASILALVIGIVAASIWYKPLGTLFEQHFAIGPIAASVLAYVLIFLASATVIEMIGRRMVSLLQIINLNWIDRLGGALLGAALAAIFAGIDVALLSDALAPNSPILQNSRLAPVLLSYNQQIAARIPPEIKQLYEEKRDALLKEWSSEKPNPTAAPARAAGGT